MRHVLLMASALAVAGCPVEDSDTGTLVDTDTDTDTESEVSLTRDVMPVFTARCAPCHRRRDGDPDATRNRVYYEEQADILKLIGGPIRAGDAANSPLIALMAGELAVGRGPTTMPPPGRADPVTGEELDTVSAWIDAGAPDD